MPETLPKETLQTEIKKLLETLEITQEDISRATIIAEDMAPLSFSTLEPPHIHMNSGEKKLWPDDPISRETKLHPISDFSDFLPPQLRQHLFQRGVLESEEPRNPDPFPEDKRKAKNAILGAMVAGLELHVEDFRDSESAEYWDGIIELWQLLHNESGVKLNITAHNPFMWGKNSLEDAAGLLNTIKAELPEGFTKHLGEMIPALNHEQIETLLEESSQVLFEVPREYPKGSGNYNFEMGFPSGFLGGTTEKQIKTFSEDPQEREYLHIALAEMTSAVTMENWKRQIEQMRDEYGIRRYTFHMAPIGARLDEGEFQRLKQNLKEYAEFARKKQVIVQMETQGISQRQYEELFDDPELSILKAEPGEIGGWAITLDLAHMDIEEVWNPSQPKGQEKPTSKFWEEKVDEGWVTEIHVSAKPMSRANVFNNADTHWRIGDDIGGRTVEIGDGEAGYETEVFVPGFTVLPSQEGGERPLLLEKVLKRQESHPDSITIAQEANASIADVVFLKGLKDAILGEQTS